MSRAQKWRNYLLGSPSTIHLLRESKVITHKENKHEEVIRSDLKRTYPLNDFFTNHIGELSNVLNTYAHVNEGMGYAQGMAFIAFNLYKIYYEDDALYAVEDTFYSLHKLIHVIRPVYPLHDKDTNALVFNNHIVSCVILLISKHDTELAKTVKEMDIIKIFTVQMLPSLFGNKFCPEDSAILLDFIIDSSSFEMFHKTLCLLSAMIISIKPVIMNMSYESVMGLMQHKGCYNARRVISIAYSIK